MSLNEFSEMYLTKHCTVYNKRPDFKVQALSTINRILGDVPLKEFSKADADHFVSVWRRRRRSEAGGGLKVKHPDGDYQLF
jgi:hypothetical protein